MRHLAALLALGLVAAPGAGRACSPVPFTPAPAPVAGEGCAIVWHVSGIRAVGLSPATDLGRGLVYQGIFDGNACHWEANLIVHDCARGVALVIGHDDRALMTEPRETGIDRIVDAMTVAAAAGLPMSLDDLASAAADEGYATRLRVPRGSPIEVNGRRLPTDCACRSFHPGLGPGN